MELCVFMWVSGCVWAGAWYKYWQTSDSLLVSSVYTDSAVYTEYMVSDYSSNQVVIPSIHKNMEVSYLRNLSQTQHLGRIKYVCSFSGFIIVYHIFLHINNSFVINLFFINFDMLIKYHLQFLSHRWTWIMKVILINYDKISNPQRIKVTSTTKSMQGCVDVISLWIDACWIFLCHFAVIKSRSL